MLLRELRKKAGYTQQEVAEYLGLAKSTVCLYEKGVYEPDIATLKKLADLFGISLDMLLDRKTDVNEDVDTWTIRERLRRDPDYRILFDAAATAKPEHLRAAAAVLKSLKGGETNGR